jgi:ABC-type branched-subunit amino acid transport system ATPase component
MCVDALVISGVRVTYGGIVALDVEEMAIPRGQVVGIVGANGAGKTTLLDVISGFTVADCGSVLLDGESEILGKAPSRRAKLGIARSFQGAELFSSMTVADTVRAALHQRLGSPSVFGAAVGAPWTRRRERAIAREADALVEQMGLLPFYDKLIGELSTGTRRIVDLACAFAQRPRVLLLDEPGAGVAQSEIDALRKLILEIRDAVGCTLVVVEHDIPLLRSISDVMFALEAGRVIARGTADEVLSDPQVVAAYLGTSETAIARSGARASRRRTETPA